MMSLLIQSNWNTLVQDKSERIEIYNYKNQEDFETFKNETENNVDLRFCFDDPDEDLNVSAERWLNILNGIIQKCFKRIRINGKKSMKELEDLFQKKEDLNINLAQADSNGSNKEQMKFLKT